MKVQMLYDQGSSEVKEDRIIDLRPFFGVIDATSTPYSPSHPALLFGDLTGGEKVAETITYVFADEIQFSPRVSLKYLIKRANQAVKDFRSDPALDIPNNIRRMMGAAITVVHVGHDVVSLVQAGDCMAIWWGKSERGWKIHFTKNQVRRHDDKMISEIGRIMRSVAGKQGINLDTATDEQISAVRKEMWDEFYPILTAARSRCRDINNPKIRTGYGFLNGDTGFFKMCCQTTIPRRNLGTIILCTDGMFPWADASKKSDAEIAGDIRTHFENGGLPAILAAARKKESQTRKRCHIDFAEATAIAIEF